MVKLPLCKPIVRVQHFICRIKSRQSQSQLLLDYDEKILRVFYSYNLCSCK